MITMNRIRDSDWKRIGPYKSLFDKTTASGRFEELDGRNKEIKTLIGRQDMAKGLNESGT